MFFKKQRELTNAEFEDFKEMMALAKGEIIEAMNILHSVGMTEEQIARIEELKPSLDRFADLCFEIADILGLKSEKFIPCTSFYFRIEDKLNLENAKEILEANKFHPVFYRYYLFRLYDND